MQASWIRRLCLLLCLCLGGVFHSAVAHAQITTAGTTSPSFSCAHAPGVDEKLICADPLLRAADHQLGQAYSVLRNANPDPTYRTSLRNDERSWILQRDTECGVTKYTVVTASNRPGYTDCILDEYAERLDDLAQMRAHPQTSPGDISHPIRSAAGPPAAAPPAASAVFSSLQLPAGTSNPLLVWRNGTVLLLTTNADGSGTVSALANGSLHSLAKMPQGVDYTQACPLEDGSILLLPAGGTPRSWISPAGKFQGQPPASLPATAQASCGGGSSMSLQNGAGATIHYGPAALGVTPAPRFVTLTTAAGTAPTSLPIRIDSRFHLSAAYLPFADAFLLNQSVNPASLAPAVERRWGKNNCRAYWQVDAKTGVVTPGCIPFGPYVNDAVVALPTQSGIYLAAGSYGLFRLVPSTAQINAANTAQLVMPGSISQASISPDGCSLAFIQTQSSTSALVVLTACSTSARTETPSAHSPAPAQH